MTDIDVPEPEQNSSMLPAAASERSPQAWSLIEELHTSATGKIYDGIPENTRRAYASDRADWRAFCELVETSELPVDGDHLAWYVTHLLVKGSPSVPEPRRHPLKPSTVERRLAAILTYAEEQGYPRPYTRSARAVLEGHRKKNRYRTRQAAPICTPELRKIVEAALRQERPNGKSAERLRARDSALVLVGWQCMARRSELAALTFSDVIWRDYGMQIAVTRAKTTREEQWIRVEYALDPNLCAVRALRTWTSLMATEGLDGQDRPLFCRLTHTDSLPRKPKPLRPESINLIVRNLADAAGLRNQITTPEGSSFEQFYTGHSLRRGPITESARKGNSHDAIGRRSGHAKGSRTLLEYIDPEQDENPMSGLV